MMFRSGMVFWTNLVKVPLLFIKCCTDCMWPLHINHEVIHFPLQLLLRLLQWSTLCIDSFNLLLWFLQALGQLLPAGWDSQHWEKENSDLLRKWCEGSLEWEKWAERAMFDAVVPGASGGPALWSGAWNGRICAQVWTVPMWRGTRNMLSILTV